MSQSVPEHTALYRYFDSDGELLYIGVSSDPDIRWKAHLYESRPGGWPKRAVRRTVEWHDSRPEALKAEEAAIKAERPRHNGTHNYDEARFDPARWPRLSPGRRVAAVAELMRSEILDGRWAHGQRIPSLSVLGAAARVSARLVSQASVKLQGEGLLDFQPGRGLFVTHPPMQRSKLPHDWFYQFGFPG
ncbi:GntR family transcriptional regulator (plasmid) [Streptomyces canus]|uniref:GntR family transcriptional regulator n=1 Tax=Streptomyces canus TaxID=58343 RepID=UPI002F91A3ED|nr:GntR family transcriptional regulator [Streptomyces canus]